MTRFSLARPALSCPGSDRPAAISAGSRRWSCVETSRVARARVFALGVFVLGGLFACSGDGGGPAAGGGRGGSASEATGGNGVAGGGGSAGQGGAAGGSGTPGDAAPPRDDDPAFATACEAAPAARHAGGAVLTLALDPQLAGKTLVLGQTVQLGDRKLTFTDVRWFVSHVVLMRKNAAPVLAEIVDQTGKPVAHGVQLVDLDMPGSLTVRVQAPAGQYDALALRFGLPPKCNSANPATCQFPLNADGAMTWVWGSGYINVRVEGKAEPAAAGGTMPANLSAHGGLFPVETPPPRLLVASPVTVPGPATLRLRLDDVLGRVGESGHLVEGGMLMSRLSAATGIATLEPAR